MDKKNFFKQCQSFKNAIATYAGDDPLQCHYDFIKWLQSNGKENCVEIFVDSLRQTIRAFKSDSRYSQDVRLAELILLHIDMQTEKLSMFENIHANNMWTKCSVFYEAWVKELIKSSKFLEAEQIIKKGFEYDAKPLHILEETHKNLLSTIGKFVLTEKWDCVTTGIHCKCKKTTPSSTYNSGFDVPVVNWEYNPLRPGEADLFSTPLFVPDPPDPNKIAKYSGDQVYVGDTEIQFEEVRARIYLKKFEVEQMVIGTPAKTTDMPGTSMIVDQFPNATANVSQSFTVTTKAALNLVQEMWNSPSVAEAVKYTNICPEKNLELFKAPEPPLFKFPVFADEENSFPMCSNNSAMFRQENAGQAVGNTGKKSLNKGGLSEKKIPPIEQEADKGVKHQLMFEGCTVSSQENIPEDVLAVNLEADLVPKHQAIPIVPFLQVPAGWTDSEFTCNTNVFNNFLMHSSTPNMKLKMDPNNPDKNLLLQTEEIKKEIKDEADKVNTCCSTANKIVDDVTGVLDNLSLATPIDPFSPELHEYLLQKLDFPNNLVGDNLGGYCTLNSAVPNFNKHTKLGNETYLISSESVKGAYAKVVRATCGIHDVALKVEKPPCYWEYYICKEIRRRVDPKNVAYFMDIKKAFIFKNGSIFEMDWAKYGTLLNVISTYKIATGRMLDIEIGIYLTIDLMNIIHILHKKCNIIHADIKPDNFVVHAIPHVDHLRPSIQLIDFGRSIDMKLMPKGYTFNQTVTTDGFQCNEMKENKPWTFQSDLYGLAGTIHCILVGDYMKVHKKKNVWTLQKNLPRGLSKQIWEPIFHQLLNIESCEVMPDLSSMITSLENLYKTCDSFNTNLIFRSFENILKRK